MATYREIRHIILLTWLDVLTSPLTSPVNLSTLARFELQISDVCTAKQKQVSYL